MIPIARGDWQTLLAMLDYIGSPFRQISCGLDRPCLDLPVLSTYNWDCKSTGVPDQLEFRRVWHAQLPPVALAF